MSREWEDKPQTERKYLHKTSDKGYDPNIYKGLLKLNSKRTNNLIKKCVKGLNRELTEEDKQMASKHMKRCFISYVIREMQIKTTIRYHCYGASKNIRGCQGLG